MPEEILFPRVLDATIRSDWRSCPQRFFYRHCRGLVRVSSRPSIHLHFGSCFARGLEVARRSYFAHADTNDALHDACEAFIQAWGDFDPQPLTTTEKAKTLASGLHALQRYFAEWPLDDHACTIHAHNDEPCVEFSFALPIPGSRHPDTGEPIIYSGRFDLIANYQGARWGLDDKTTGSDPNSDSWRNQWKLRGQFSGYTWGAREYGMPLRGFIVRGVGIQQRDIKFGFALTPRPPWMVDFWLRQLQDDVAQMCEQWHLWRAIELSGSQSLTIPFPLSLDHACSDFGGCTFLDLCTSEDPSRWLNEFSVQRWNPLEGPSHK